MTLILRQLPRKALSPLSALPLSQSRRLHAKADRYSRPLSTYSLPSDPHLDSHDTSPPTTSLLKHHPLSILPLSSILRSISILTASCSPSLLRLSLRSLNLLAHPPNRLLDAEQNPLLRWVIKRTLYAQFCAGSNKLEISKTVDGLREMGYKGVILAYAREKEVDKHAKIDTSKEKMLETEQDIAEIRQWMEGNLQTVQLAQKGDFVGLKFTGAGSLALRTMATNCLCSPTLSSAITSICDLAKSRSVRLLFDAEHTAVQTAIDDWTLSFMQRYNLVGSPPVVYGTYQAYLKATPSVLSRHLEAARAGNFTLGVKLVRGAYLGSDPRELICDTKADTDAQYDGITAALLQRQANSILQVSNFPELSLVLASHNQESVRAAQRIRNTQSLSPSPRGTGEKIDLAYAQLMGMADEVSCELLASTHASNKTGDVPRAYKYLVWGTPGECMQYLLRRAQENQDAVARTRIGRDAMLKELWRRVKSVAGFA